MTEEDIRRIVREEIAKDRPKIHNHVTMQICRAAQPIMDYARQSVRDMARRGL